MIEILALGFLALLSTLFILGGQFRQYYLDAYRQEIFKIRDDLFYFAADGHISFDNEGYKFARIYLNGMIRFAEKISLMRIVLIHNHRPRDESQFQARLEASMKDLNQEQRDKVMNGLHDATVTTISYLLKRSAILHLLAKLVQWIESLRQLSVVKAFPQTFNRSYADEIYTAGAKEPKLA